MKVAIVQNRPDFGNVQGNLNRIEKMLVGKIADLFVLPELFATGYRFKNMDEAHQFAEPVPDGRTSNFLLSLVKKTMHILLLGWSKWKAITYIILLSSLGQRVLLAVTEKFIYLILRSPVFILVRMHHRFLILAMSRSV